LTHVTVGICAYNEGKNIGQLLNNVLHDQGMSADSEVLVVCSGCTDGTDEIVRRFAKEDKRVKPYFEKNRTGKALAINYILAHASGETIFLISADVLPKKNIFPHLLAKLENQNVGLVCGNPVPVNDPHLLVGRIVKILWSFHGHVFAELNDAGLAKHASEAFCIRKGIVNRIPADTVNDDGYIAIAAKKKGWLVKFSSDCTVSMCGPRTYKEYFEQRRRIIFGHFQLRKLTGESSQYLIHMAPAQPVRTLKLISWLFTKYDLASLSAFFMTELFVNVTALTDFTFGKKHSQWQRLASTKTVITSA
jgi:poly-beta-1,6-N-acetyl-D-glucosamine synthase